MFLATQTYIFQFHVYILNGSNSNIKIEIVLKHAKNIVAISRKENTKSVMGHLSWK